MRIPAGGARHQVVVTEPHPDFAPERLPMVFDVASGIYWRPEEGGVLWGMSNPDEAAGRGDASSTTAYYERMRAADGRRCCRRPAKVGLRKTWAATIDFTPDHLPILGPALGADGPVAGTVVAAAGGHGMMWGPGVAAGGRRPRARPAPPTSSTSPTSASTGSTSTAAAASPPTPSPCPSPTALTATAAVALTVKRRRRADRQR